MDLEYFVQILTEMYQLVHFGMKSGKQAEDLWPEREERKSVILQQSACRPQVPPPHA